MFLCRQNREAARAEQQGKNRMFWIEEQHIHVVQWITTERNSYHFHSGLAMQVNMCLIQRPIQLLYLKSEMYL